MKLPTLSPRFSASRRGLIALLLLSSLLVSAGTAGTQNVDTPARTLTVTNTSEALNGDVSNPAALIANPGADGISLIEALVAVEADTGAHETIDFDPSLTGSVINLSQNLPPIWRDGLTLDGDGNDDGIPDITLEGSDRVSQALPIRASEVNIEGLHFRDFTATAIEISTLPDPNDRLVENVALRHNIFTNIGESAIVLRNDQDHAVIRDIEISGNTFQNYRFGIKLHAGFAPGANDDEISNVSIVSNTLLVNRSAVGIFISPSGVANTSHNTIRDIQIRGNTIRGHTNSSILIDAANQADCNHNLTSNITITENQIDGTPVTIELVSVGESGTNATGNLLSNVTLTDNTLTGGGIHIGGATGRNSHANAISGVLIDRDHIISSVANGIYLNAGSSSAHDNLIENVVMRNTFVGDCHDAGVLMHGDDSSSPNNAINNVTIANLTLVKNGVDSLWAGGLNLNSLDASNTIRGVTVSSTVLWQNGGGDSIRGSLTPASVIHSRLNGAPFAGNNGNINLSPGFVNPASGDYHLQPTSPCIDSGDPTAANAGTFDLDKNSRLWDGNGDGLAEVDMGAYELDITIPPQTDGQGNGDNPPMGMLCLAASLALALALGLWVWRKRRRSASPKR